MKRTLALVFALGVAGPAAAEASEAEIAAFVAAVEAIGCRVETDAQAEAVERATGFDEATLSAIVATLLDSGRAVIPASMEGLRLTTGGCG